MPVDEVVLDTSKDENLPKSSDVGTSSGYTYTPMAVKVGNDYKGILYEFSGGNSYLKYADNEDYQGDSLGYREPDVVKVYDADMGISKEALQEDYNNMIESVKKYKGFYIARYEAGLDENNNIVFKNSDTETNVTTADASNSETESWYGLYEKIKTFTTSNDNLVSNMIWGSQYDAMMNWMITTGEEPGTEDDTKRNSFNDPVATGRDTNDVINNIYDLYGCHHEWTLEMISDDSRTHRGGSIAYNYSPAYRFQTDTASTFRGCSSRATLYIK